MKPRKFSIVLGICVLLTIGMVASGVNNDNNWDSNDGQEWFFPPFWRDGLPLLAHSPHNMDFDRRSERSVEKSLNTDNSSWLYK